MSQDMRDLLLILVGAPLVILVPVFVLLLVQAA